MDSRRQQRHLRQLSRILRETGRVAEAAAAERIAHELLELESARSSQRPSDVLAWPRLEPAA